jgi:hypothetical protein
VKVEFKLGEMFSRVGFIVTNLGMDSRVVVCFYNKRSTAEQWIKEGKQAVEDDAAELPLLEHCILTGAGVRLWVGREVKMEIPDYLGSCAHSETNHPSPLAQPLADDHRFVGR